MLQEIYIKNFVLIDELRLSFEQGLNVLTGETGAGKSIIIDALGLVLGERVRNDLLRDSQKKAIVEAVFVVENNSAAHSVLLENGLLEEEEDCIVVSREIATSGRSLARINGRNVNVGFLKSLARQLVDMHLQDENSGFLNPANYLQFIDSFVQQGEEIGPKIESLFLEIREKERQLDDYRNSEKDRLQKIDFMTYQINEIEKAGLRSGEEEELLALNKRIKNAQALEEGTGRILELLYHRQHGGESALDLIAASLESLGRLKDDEFLSRLQSPLEEIYYSLQDIASQLSSFRESLDFEPGLLEESEERLYQLQRLKGKYGQSIDEILAYLEKTQLELEYIENTGERQEKLEESIVELKLRYNHLAAQLSQLRQSAAQRLQDSVDIELRELNMPQVKFAVKLEARETPGIKGMDRVDFLFSPNPGEEMHPLSRIASGGERSRFILALKKALAGIYMIPTLIFDEIDVGVGGTALVAMAYKLYELSLEHQLILVTHSPQIASLARQHFQIEKSSSEDCTRTTVRELATEARVEEIARMLEGEDFSPLALEHAREMLTRRDLTQAAVKRE
ncbi:MAG: DNA repair protein RecN [Syntrophomonas sp.]|uniref:DNA repair protein RecN n=1 Tax=Syntrophomonas sp. TaxID=2053627 RepID=UPI002610CC90|nr:DNA repair protein RecN [Syntrophomonas sp.]MDD2510518.1 DNA repair protein RecN [Syntrophomonas sp.]MDD3879668.1 DNA repair protein RecN [Syntrophomonas sp.]MDD4626965.1 DNA repair protein RecN [Syntrophomonas sp.]